jgi:hypothetical protein
MHCCLPGKPPGLTGSRTISGLVPSRQIRPPARSGGTSRSACNTGLQCISRSSTLLLRFAGRQIGLQGGVKYLVSYLPGIETWICYEEEVLGFLPARDRSALRRKIPGFSHPVRYRNTGKEQVRQVDSQRVSKIKKMPVKGHSHPRPQRTIKSL